MHSKEQISKELALQVNSAYEEFFQGLELIESAFLDSSFGTYVKMVRLINEMKDVKEVELEKVTLEKLLKGKAFSKKKEELFWGYYEYATGYLFPTQKVLDVMASMIENGMALFFFPFDDCSQELIINCSKEHYKIPEKSDLEEVLKKATREYLQSKVKMLNCDFSNESEKVDLLEPLTSPELSGEDFNQVEFSDLSDDPVSLKSLGKSEKEMIGDNESNISITFSESKSIREGKTV